MGKRENKVETTLDEQIEALGGLTRKWVSPGKRGVPDRIVKVPGYEPWFVEVKTLDGVLSGDQVREHERLIKVGFNVATIYGLGDVFKFIERFK